VAVLRHPSEPSFMLAGNFVFDECDGLQDGIGHVLRTGGSCLLKMFFDVQFDGEGLDRRRVFGASVGPPRIKWGINAVLNRICYSSVINGFPLLLFRVGLDLGAGYSPDRRKLLEDRWRVFKVPVYDRHVGVGCKRLVALGGFGPGDSDYVEAGDVSCSRCWMTAPPCLPVAPKTRTVILATWRSPGTPKHESIKLTCCPWRLRSRCSEAELKKQVD